MRDPTHFALKPSSVYDSPMLRASAAIFLSRVISSCHDSVSSRSCTPIQNNPLPQKKNMHHHRVQHRPNHDAKRCDCRSVDTSTISSVRRGRRTTAAAQSGSENNQRNVFKSENFLGTVHAFHFAASGHTGVSKNKTSAHTMHTHTRKAHQKTFRGRLVFFT